MAKRIVSGIFILTALGALGVILAGAMTSGEQLIVRFLTAVTVAALALYVISDLRLQHEQDEPPVERNDSSTARPTMQTPTVMATVTGSHRRDQLGRQSHEPAAQPTANFEAIEPVTARSRSVAVADPTEAVTGSRLVASASEPSAIRTLPPHPSSGRPIPDHAERDDAWAVPAATTPPMPPDDPPSENVVSPDHDVADTPVVADTTVEATDEADNAGGNTDSEAATEHVDAVPEFLTPPDERMTTSASNSVIASTAFTYSGRLDSDGVEWPPKPPTPVDPDEHGSPADDDEAEPAGAIDAPTAELPALPDLPGLAAYDDDSLLAMFDAEIDGEIDDEDDDQPGSLGRRVHLFAVETAEIPMTETTGSDLSTPVDETASDEPVAEVDGASAAEATEEPVAPSRPLIRRLEAAEYAAPPRTELIDLREQDAAAATTDFGSPVPTAQPTEVSLPDKLTAAIRSGEIQVINSLISQGMLSTSGEITDRDVRTMVYVAFTSNELRKLILAGGTPDGIRAGDLDLGEVELFDESRFAPPPKRLYAGPPDPVAAPEAVLDLVALEEEAATATASSHHEHDLDEVELVPTLPTPRHLYRRGDVDRVEQ